MADRYIPLRPTEDNFVIPKEDKDIIAFAVLFGCDNATAFARFHPEYLTTQGKLSRMGETQCKAFFAYAKNREYRDAYISTLAEFAQRKRTKKQPTDEPNVLTEDERKDKALNSLLNQAMQLVENGSELDPDTLKTVAEIFKRLGILKDEVEETEAPRRYLPARCYSECSYRLCVEQAIKQGEAINECDYCRTRKFAEQNGWLYDACKNLDLPPEVAPEQQQIINP